jgi:microcystin degradation protein MlrC
MKLFVAGIATETNTYAMSPTGQAAWAVHRGPAGGSAWQPVVERLSTESGHQAVLGLLAEAHPGGLTVRTTYEHLRDELLADLRAALPVHAVLLPLHGAMVADGYPDCEGDLIEQVRAVVGAGVPIGVELDLHCHLTRKMLQNADVVIAYKAYPHTDMAERFEELWRLVVAMAEGRIRPVTAVHDCRMLGFWHTTREPMKSFVHRMQQVEREPGVLSVSFGHGFPWGDVPEAGAKVWVVADGDAALAAHWARTLGEEIWQLRHQTGARQSSLPAALEVLQAWEGGSPIVVADIADNAGGGASSDATFILEALLARGIGNVALGGFYDLGAVQVCREAGVGARLALRVGGKLGPASGQPVDLWATVRAIREEHTQTVLGMGARPCGCGVWVSTDEGLDIVLIGERTQVFGTDLFTGLGIGLTGKRAIVVKSSQHFHAAFAPLASQVLYVETPGLLRTDFAGLPYRHRDTRVWPLVEDPWHNP